MTKRELEALAVRALGEGAKVEIKRMSSWWWIAQATRVETDGKLIIPRRDSSRGFAIRALAAALTALAEGK